MLDCMLKLAQAALQGPWAAGGWQEALQLSRLLRQAVTLLYSCQERPAPCGKNWA